MKHWLELCSSAFFFFILQTRYRQISAVVTTGPASKAVFVLVRVETREAAVGLDDEGGKGGEVSWPRKKGFVRFFPIKEIIPVK